MMASNSTDNLNDLLKDAPTMNSNTNSLPLPSVNANTATSNADLPEQVSSPTGGSSASKFSLDKIQSIKCWGVSTYKCTRQLMYERLGKTERTVDKELEVKIEVLRDTHKRYLYLLSLSTLLTRHFRDMVQTQQMLGDVFIDLSQKSPELLQEFESNAETQKSLARRGEMLISVLKVFLSSIDTLCNQTINDSLTTIQNYETARIKYDAYRMDLESLAGSAGGEANTARIDEAQLSYQKHKDEFENLRSTVEIKLNLLENNRINVMRKHLQLLNNAVLSYFSGNLKDLEESLQTFCKKAAAAGDIDVSNFSS